MNKKICFILSIVVFLLFPFLVSAEGEVYDIVLFWGQSNMVGINKDHKNVGISQNSNIAFEYLYSTNSLREISDKISSFGETLQYNPTDLTLKATNPQSYCSLEASGGTNMIPQFAKTYYDLTGRKIVAVMAANGGEPIAHFLPHERVLELSNRPEAAKNQYIYEALKKKYEAALSYIKNSGDTIGRQLYVVFQGESDAHAIAAPENYEYNNSGYYSRFMEVHKNLKKLGLEYGLLIKTSYALNSDAIGVNEIHIAQQNLISENSNIILGSSFPYDNYIKNDSTYLLNDKLHFNATALSTIGDSCAIEASKYLINNYSWLTSLKIGTQDIEITDKTTYEVSVPYETESVKIDASLLSNSLNFAENYDPRVVSLNEGVNTFNLKINDGNVNNNKTYTIKITREEKEDIEKKEEDTKPNTDKDLVVKVPDTLSHKSVLFIAIGIIIMSCGVFMIIYVKNKKCTKNEK